MSDNLNTYKITFYASFMTDHPGVFYDDTMWIEAEYESIKDAEVLAMKTITYNLIEVEELVLKKIELIKIEEIDKDTNTVIQTLNYIDNDN